MIVTRSRSVIVNRTYCIAIAAPSERNFQSAIYSPRTGNREAKIYLLKTNLHHLIDTQMQPQIFFSSHWLGKSRVILVKDTIKTIYRGKFGLLMLFKKTQKDQVIGFSLRELLNKVYIYTVYGEVRAIRLLEKGREGNLPL